MPPTDYVSRAYVDVDGTNAGVSEVSWNGAADGLEPVKTMNRQNRGVGYTNGAMMYTFSLTYPLAVKGEEVDFHRLMVDETEFAATIEYEGGGTRVFTRCRVASVDTPSSNDSGTDQAVECLALDMSKTGAR